MLSLYRQSLQRGRAPFLRLTKIVLTCPPETARMGAGGPVRHSTSSCDGGKPALEAIRIRCDLPDVPAAWTDGASRIGWRRSTILVPFDSLNTFLRPSSAGLKSRR